MSLTVALIGATIVGLTHGAAHYAFGDPDTFGRAAVNQAGVAVTAVTFVVLFLFV